MIYMITYIHDIPNIHDIIVLLLHKPHGIRIILISCMLGLYLVVVDEYSRSNIARSNIARIPLPGLAMLDLLKKGRPSEW